MAPSRTKKARSSTDSEISSRPALVDTKSPARTPTRSPQKQIMSITEAQKQALMDNLQLEVTERARKLRAQYALQAQSLRTRIELRVNRIPTALRKANMGELYAKYSEMRAEKERKESEKPRVAEPSKVRDVTQDKVVGIANLVQGSRPIHSKPEPDPRGVKRHSDTLEATDKENIQDDHQAIPNPKKRAKASKSRQAPNPSTVLSPKSANSRTLPQSPVRPILGSPAKSYLSRPVSPLKPSSPVKMAPAAATATLAGMVQEKTKPVRPKASAGRKATNPPTTTAKGVGTRAKRGAGADFQEPEDVRKASNTSNISNFSTATTVVKPARKGAAGTGKMGEIGIRAKVTAAKEAPSTGRRVLRKRA